MSVVYAAWPPLINVRQRGIPADGTSKPEEHGGLVPRPVSIGRAKFWRSAELRAWVASGCLSRRMWDVRGGAEKE